MNSAMRSMPFSSRRGATSTSTSPEATVVPAGASPMATSELSPPSEAPISTGGVDCTAATARTSAANSSSV